MKGYVLYQGYCGGTVIMGVDHKTAPSEPSLVDVFEHLKK